MELRYNSSILESILEFSGITPPKPFPLYKGRREWGL